MFCFECGFKLIEGSKFCSSCGTAQITANQTFEVSVTVFSESWTEEIDSSGHDLNSAAECIQRSNDSWGSYLTFAEGAEQKIEGTPFMGTNVDHGQVSEPAIGASDNRIDFISSRFEDNMWVFVVRYEVEVTLQVTASSESSVREICQNQIQESFAIYGSASGEIFSIDELKITETLDEAAIAKNKAALEALMAKIRL